MYMENKSLLELLLTLPKNCKHATIQGVELQLINSATKDKLLQGDPEGLYYHECILANGTFVFTKENGNLHSLYKVI